jgi:hypothetical protein
MRSRIFSRRFWKEKSPMSRWRLKPSEKSCGEWVSTRTSINICLPLPRIVATEFAPERMIWWKSLRSKTTRNAGLHREEQGAVQLTDRYHDDHDQSSRHAVKPSALQTRRHAGEGLPADPCPRSPGRAARHLPRNGGAVLPLFLLRRVALQNGRGSHS